VRVHCLPDVATTVDLLKQNPGRGTLCFDNHLKNQLFILRYAICTVSQIIHLPEIPTTMNRIERGPMSYDKDQAIREFRHWSEGYDRCILQRLLFEPSHRAIIARIRARASARPLAVLDVGCGTGVFAARIRECLPQSRVCGVDLVSAMLVKGRSRWRADALHVTAVQGDSERLPFADGMFDVVTCANSFHHYPHQDRAVAEMHRVLKPGGRLLLVDGCRDGVWGWFIYDVCVAGVEGDVLHASARRVNDLFRRAGFVDTTQKVHHGLAPFLLTEGVARSTAPPKVRSSAGRSAPSRALVREFQ
jgi:SAM-dependent methyltransferase